MTIETFKQNIRNPLLAATLSMGWNLVYALFHLILAVYHSSWWFLTMAAYYAALGFMRLSGVSMSWKSNHRSEKTVMRHNGEALIVLGFVICGMVLLSIREGVGQTYHIVVMIAIAIYTFYLAAMAVINMVRARKTRSAQMITLRNISLAGAVGGMLTLERSMLATFGDTTDRFSHVMKAASGGAAFLIIVLLGVGMIRFSRNMEENES